MVDELEKIKEQLEEKGVVILEDTAVCIAYLDDHMTCKGCISEDGCKQFAELVMKSLQDI